MKNVKTLKPPFTIFFSGVLASDNLYPQRHDLTEREVYAIKGSWPKASESSDVAVKILYNYFKSYPAAQEGYPKFKGQPLDELKGHPDFKSHAYKMYDFFDGGVRYAKPGPKKTTCKPLEEMSAGYVKKGLINRERFASFREPLLDSLDVKKETRDAWNKYLDNIYTLLFSQFPQNEKH